MNAEHESFQSQIKELRTEIKAMRRELEKVRETANRGIAVAIVAVGGALAAILTG